MNMHAGFSTQAVRSHYVSTDCLSPTVYARCSPWHTCPLPCSLSQPVPSCIYLPSTTILSSSSPFSLTAFSDSPPPHPSIPFVTISYLSTLPPPTTLQHPSTATQTPAPSPIFLHHPRLPFQGGTFHPTASWGSSP